MRDRIPLLHRVVSADSGDVTISPERSTALSCGMKSLGGYALKNRVRTVGASVREVLLVTGCSAGLGLTIVPAARAQAAPPSSQTPQGALQEVVVTAQQIKQPLLNVPVSVSVLSGSQLQAQNVHDFQGYAEKIPNLSFDYGAVGIAGYQNTLEIAIRGIEGPNTTGFYINDVEIPNSINPQIIDVQRIEVLKGPQGTLYGAGSMGGDVRILTNQPTFKDEYSYTVSGGHTQDSPTSDYRVTGIGNVSLIDGVAALRIVGFFDHQGGWLTRTYSDRLPTIYPTSSSNPVDGVDNQGATRTYGGSATLLIKPGADFSATLGVMAQHNDGLGRAAQFAPLPLFEPNGYVVPRESNFQEMDAEDWILPSMVLRYDAEYWDVESSTSYLERNVHQNEDGTEGDQDILYELTGVVLPPPPNGPQYHWLLRTGNYWFDQEIHANIKQISFFRAALGAQYTDQVENDNFPPVLYPGLAASGIFPTDLLYASHYNTDVSQTAVFGQTYSDFGKFELTLGARWYHIDSVAGANYANGFYGSPPNPRSTETEKGISPKIALSYKPTRNAMVYASATKGYRPGGSNNPLPEICNAGLPEIGLSAGATKAYHSDSLWDYEIGGKAQMGGLLLTGAAFQMNWTQMQQSILVPVCFLPVTTNVGAARIRGAEFEMQGSPMNGLQLQVGVGYEEPRLLNGSTGGFAAGARIPYIPFINGSVSAMYTHAVTDSVNGFVSTDFSYEGSSLSARTPAALGPQERGGYGLLNARLGVDWERYELEIYVKNVTSKEPNLGDLYLLSVNQVDTNGIDIPMVVVPPPRQVGVQFSRDF